jgi:trk system potassium uptake protein TrkH
MNFKMMGRFIAQILGIEAFFMLPALAISLYDREVPAIYGFTASLVIIGLVAGGLWLMCRKSKRGFYEREGLACVGIAWVSMSLLGCLPFYLSGEIPHYVDALFEIVSGFTTTGASILTNVEAMSRGLLYWRSFSHWLGGMGVLVFLLAIAPSGGRSGGFTVHLLRAESPGPNVGKLVPRMRQTAMILYLIYVVLTVLNIFFLLIGGMPLFDSLCTAFGTAGTGGFGIRNDSIASYSPYLQNVCTVFMLLFGVNFSCYYLLLIRQFRSVFRDEELRLYLGVVAVSVVAIAINVRGFYDTLGETVRHAAFQVASIVTTTGFATTDFDLWPSFSKTILLCLMVIGACAGSTGGGFKCGRLVLLLKGLRRNIRQVLYPQRVETVRVNGRTVEERVLENTNAYLAAYVVILVLSIVVVSLDGFSITTNLSAVLSCFNNIGPGLDQVGPTCNYAGYSVLSKLVLTLDMLAGRLEIFPMLVLFSRSTWRRR